MVNKFVHVQSDFVDVQWEQDGGVREGGRDRGRKGRSGNGRQEEWIFGGREGEGGRWDDSCHKPASPYRAMT